MCQNILYEIFWFKPRNVITWYIYIVQIIFSFLFFFTFQAVEGNRFTGVFVKQEESSSEVKREVSHIVEWVKCYVAV